MSTIVISNIKATGETASRAVSGVAAAWVNFDGTGTVAIRDSLNGSSITDLAAGEYTVNFTSNMNNTNYATQVTASSNSSYNLDGLAIACVGMNLSTPYVNVGNVSVMVGLSANGNGNDAASNVVNVTNHGDLA